MTGSRTSRSPQRDHGKERPKRPPLTPVALKAMSHLVVPVASTLSRHSSPGVAEFAKRRALTPQRKTASPAPSLLENTRRRLPGHHSVDHAVKLIRESKNIVVLIGAGISTSLGIPDFRSSSGFYSKLSSEIGITEPEEFFSLEFFKHNSAAFWNNVKPLMPKYALDKNGRYKKSDPGLRSEDEEIVRPRFSTTHAFLALLQAQGRLLTVYTQNIDGLEFAAGLHEDKVLQCHGSWDTATCLTCGKTIKARQYFKVVYNDNYPRCSCTGTPDESHRKTASRPGRKRKRPVYEGDSDHDSDDGTGGPKGLYKPDITFFGEAISSVYDDRLEDDQPKIDLLIVIGTSLKVKPVKNMVTAISPEVPQIWINRERFNGTGCDMPGVRLDIELLGDCNTVIEELCRRAKLDLEPHLWPNVKTRHIARSTASKTNGLKDHHSRASQNDTRTDSAIQERQENLHQRFDTASDEEGNGSTGVRIEPDLDAVWRWRFSQKP